MRLPYWSKNQTTADKKLDNLSETSFILKPVVLQNTFDLRLPGLYEVFSQSKAIARHATNFLWAACRSQFHSTKGLFGASKILSKVTAGSTRWGQEHLPSLLEHAVHVRSAQREERGRVCGGAGNSVERRTWDRLDRRLYEHTTFVRFLIEPVLVA